MLEAAIERTNIIEVSQTEKRRNIWAAGLGYLADGLDQLIISYTLPAIVATFALTTIQAGSIATATMIGTWLGAYVFGFLADYFGRVKTFTYSILVYALATGISAFSPSYEYLMILRFLVGVGIGGEFGIGMALVTETWPSKWRARAGSYVAVGFSIGALLASIVTLLVMPIWGWRGVMVVGVIPAALAVWSRLKIKEPAIFEENKSSGNKKFPLVYLFNTTTRAKATIGLWFMTAVQNFGYYGIMIWMPTALAKYHHYSLADTTEWELITTAGMIGGIILFGVLCDKIGRKPMYITLFLLTAIVIPIYFSISNPSIVLFGGFVLGAVVNGGMGGYGAILSEHFPTAARSTAENFIFGTGRGIGGGFGPLLIGLLAVHMSLYAALGFLFIVYPFAALFTWLLVPETKGIELPA
ncbi:MFS transporter [Sulfoacidibacillus ferrooxidans]|uniref:Niacin/nicotinamide transporter NaiP n=1 Tax=Sulfoacidibacillus ferrooxidans TaxID=2005001 RepID=A0A9X1VDQ1_9BACL|nr:MFS transporter [Sulfoacidibacillus ferrooxidans]MCI0184243.1 putative niacin/nicotinamide transporter NaiP [Sulfoacidibacillus ferrooxidans]